MTLQQTRFAELNRPEGGETLSVVKVREDGETVFEHVLLELPDRNNQHNVSRIPEGRYVFEVVEESPAFDYPHPWVHDEGETDAAGRLGIKWHVANFARQLRGCGAPGQSFVDLDGDGLVDVTHSAKTLDRLLQVIPRVSELHISEAQGQVPAAPLASSGASSFAQHLSPVHPPYVRSPSSA
jgi:hypothetical protein